MQIEETALAGCFKLTPTKHIDHRGNFIKWFSREAFDRANLCSDWAEVYGSVSRRGVIRGLHFQSPPADHAKLVYCLGGRAIDVVLDLRSALASYGEHIKIELSGDSPLAVYVPAGCAHGFLALEDNTLMFYQVSSDHTQALDSGIRWDSAEIDWPIVTPTVSPRDEALPRLADFVSPFR